MQFSYSTHSCIGCLVGFSLPDLLTSRLVNGRETRLKG